jgi:CheY-like chemotaxis protein
MKVLIVDDSQAQCHLFSRLLKELGYADILSCQSVPAARECLGRENGIGIVFADYHMPLGTGVDLLKWVRETPATAKIPFIMITTEQEKGVVLTAARLGLQSYMFKPVQKETLKAKLYELSQSHGTQPPAEGQTIRK